jgi:hypothetical protein
MLLSILHTANNLCTYITFAYSMYQLINFFRADTYTNTIEHVVV